MAIGVEPIRAVRVTVRTSAMRMVRPQGAIRLLLAVNWARNLVVRQGVAVDVLLAVIRGCQDL
jgi:hypothetical protein